MERTITRKTREKAKTLPRKKYEAAPIHQHEFDPDSRVFDKEHNVWRETCQVCGFVNEYEEF